MIEFYSGTPGSGKSLHVAQRIYNKILFKKEDVIANFDINVDMLNKKKKKKRGRFTYVENNKLSPSYFIEYYKKYHKTNKEGQTLVIIDECQIMFNSRNWQDKQRLEWINFFTQHRKFGFNFILVSQFDRLIDRQIRALFEYEVIHRKVNNFKIGMLLPFKMFVAISRWYNAKERIGAEYFIYKNKYGKLYDSYKNFEKDPKTKQIINKAEGFPQ